MADPSCGLNDTTDSTGPAGLVLVLFLDGTWVHGLFPWSAAADAADTASCPAEDQRGVARPIDVLGGGAICDVGAHEVDMLTMAPGPKPTPALPGGWLFVAGAALASVVVRRG